jgi:hypothetical protein
VHVRAAPVGGDVDDAYAGALGARVDSENSDHVVSLRHQA